MQPLDLTRAANLHEESLSSMDSDCVEIDQESKLLDLTSTALLADPSCIKDRLAKVNKGSQSISSFPLLDYSLTMSLVNRNDS